MMLLFSENGVVLGEGLVALPHQIEPSGEHQKQTNRCTKRNKWGWGMSVPSPADFGSGERREFPARRKHFGVF